MPQQPADLYIQTPVPHSSLLASNPQAGQTPRLKLLYLRNWHLPFISIYFLHMSPED